MEQLEKLTGVYFVEDHIATENLNPGIKVYGERLVEFEGKEYRIWEQRRSKLGAAIMNGMNMFPFEEKFKSTLPRCFIRNYSFTYFRHNNRRHCLVCGVFTPYDEKSCRTL